VLPWAVLASVLSQARQWREATRDDSTYDPGKTLFTVLVGGNDMIYFDKPVDKILASSAEFVGGFALPIWFFDLCSAQAQAYPPSLPVGKPTCLSLAHRRLVHRCEALGG
jgi:hypothetical protein